MVECWWSEVVPIPSFKPQHVTVPNSNPHSFSLSYSQPLPRPPLSHYLAHTRTPHYLLLPLPLAGIYSLYIYADICPLIITQQTFTHSHSRYHCTHSHTYTHTLRTIALISYPYPDLPMHSHTHPHALAQKDTALYAKALSYQRESTHHFQKGSLGQ